MYHRPPLLKPMIVLTKVQNKTSHSQKCPVREPPAQNRINCYPRWLSPWRLPAAVFLCLLVLFQLQLALPTFTPRALETRRQRGDSEPERSTSTSGVLAALAKSICWQHICTNIYRSFRCLQMRPSCEELCREVATRYPTPAPPHGRARSLHLNLPKPPPPLHVWCPELSSIT